MNPDSELFFFRARRVEKEARSYRKQNKPEITTLDGRRPGGARGGGKAAGQLKGCMYVAVSQVTLEG